LDEIGICFKAMILHDSVFVKGTVRGVTCKRLPPPSSISLCQQLDDFSLTRR